MKKILLILSLFILVGCSKEDSFNCKIDLYNELQDYNFKANYKVYYKDSFVIKVEKEEIYSSNNKNTIKYFDEYKNLELNSFNELYGGIIYNIRKKNNEIIINSIIDFNKLDIKQMIKNKYIDRNYVKSNRLTTSGIKLIYKQKGAECQ